MRSEYSTVIFKMGIKFILISCVIKIISLVKIIFKEKLVLCLRRWRKDLILQVSEY